ncbi:MAG: hypothetical protein Q9191_000233 [Dirinaria sp. TL-2023a]
MAEIKRRCRIHGTLLAKFSNNAAEMNFETVLEDRGRGHKGNFFAYKSRDLVVDLPINKGKCGSIVERPARGNVRNREIWLPSSAGSSKISDPNDITRKTIIMLSSDTKENLHLLTRQLRHPHDVDIRNNNGETLLLCAVQVGNEEAVDQLLQAGADLFASSTAGPASEARRQLELSQQNCKAVEELEKSTLDALTM